jgi:hypothetical protein
MKISSAKAKGKLLEDYVADQIVLKGIDPKARRDGASGAGNREKGDICTSMMILGQNVGIECKNQSTLKIQEWWRQTAKMEKLQREPVLIFHIENEPFSETKAVIYLDTLLEMSKSASGKPQILEIIPEDSRDKKWKIQNAITVLKNLLKEYDN